MSSHPQRPWLSIWLHWLTLLLMLVLVAVVLARDELEGKALKLELLNLHRSLGLLLLFSLLLRAPLWLWFEARRPHTQVRWQERLLAAASHTGLLLLLAGLPVVGWMASNARGHEVALFGVVHLPMLAELDTDRADDLVHYHEVGAWLLGGLVVLHAAAALWHHFIRRDDTLRSMLPAADAVSSPDSRA